MPVTAKLSRRFYEVLGNDVANELVEWFKMVDTTYRSDLRELNDLNFTRFDAKVGERFAEFEVRLLRQLTELESRTDKRFAEMDRRFAKQDGMLEKRLGELRSDLIKWMFIFWATSALSVLGMLEL